MRIGVISWLILVAASQAITLEVYQVFRPISLHGTDMAEEFEGNVIQAKVIPQTMVVTGAQPEGLLSAIASPHRLTGSDSYLVKEDNLLVLCGIGMKSRSDGKNLTVDFDLSQLKIPKDVEIPVRTVLKLAIQSVKETLKGFHTPEDGPMKLKIQIVGTNDGTAPLQDLSQKFRVGE
ncbi:hypothetical protein N9A86_00455 [Akkermansiaceae bacterium]|nr:hypothetical protein [Akkermansiaceae bacterium]MDB4544861.1 hypothetical protein [Akkermansiaceae bacterium]